MAIEVVDRSGGERLSDGPVTLRILEDGSHTGHRIGVVEGTLPPRTGGPPEHVHRQHDETFFVVSGSPTFTSGGNTITAQPRTLVAVPAGTPHTFANPGEQPAVILATFTPALFVGYFREIANLRPGPTGLDLDEVAEAMARYATEVVTGAP